jgi:glycosyltransferase involved in cell wall biosynthesis
VVAEFYPRDEDPALGVWAHRQAMAARDAGADVRVLVLDRPVPSAAAARDATRGRPGRLISELRAAARRPPRETRDGIEIEYVRFLAPPRSRTYALWHRWARRPLAAALDRAPRFDLVHAHYAHLAGPAALAWARPRGVPLVVSVHGGDVLAPQLAGPSTDTLRQATGVMCNSRATLARAAALAGSSHHMRVVHLGTDIPAELPPKHEQPTVATLANLDPRKRHEDVLRALALLPPYVRWIAIGKGPERGRLEALARELGVQRRVTFTGQLAPHEAHEQLARCHAMAMPSVDEAFGVAYVEAMARAVPAIGCAGEGGPEEIAALGDGMLLVPPRDAVALGDAIKGAMADTGLGERARATAAANFTWQACGAATVAAYEDALAR